MLGEIGTLVPVVVFAYNRPEKLDKCLNNLEKCDGAAETPLFICCDGAKGTADREKVDRVRDIAYKHAANPAFKEVNVITQDSNKGLAASIITGVTQIINKFGSVIVVEDDLVVLPSFLSFLNEGLGFYKDAKEYGSISAFTYPIRELQEYVGDVFSTRKAECWGWATWADRWNNAEWENTDFSSYLKDRKERIRFERLEAGLDRLMYLQYKGKIDSWAVRWVYYLFKKDMLTVYPSKSRVENDGFDGSGTHCADGFGTGFNSTDTDDGSDVRWEKCGLNETLADSYAKFPRRKLVLYIAETIKYLMKTG